MSLTLLPASAFKAEAQPLFATPRNPHRDTIGPDVCLIAERLGKKPMPWQRRFLDTAYELDPETGQLWYTEIVILLMRQQGKSTLMLPAGVHRAVGWEQKQNILFMAQKRTSARRKFTGEQVPVIRASPFWRLIGDKNYRETNGDEGLTFKGGNGSWWGIDAPTESSGHGDTLGLGFVDEYWWQVDNRVEQAMSPTMITVDDAQKWFMSTAGNARSVPLKKKRDLGRERVRLGIDSRTMYLEYAIPEEEDPFDPRVWRQYMPALGHTIKEFKIAAERENLADDNEFRRAYGNQWLDGYTGDWPIPETDWNACSDPDSEIVQAMVWSVDVAPDMAYAAISIAGLRADGIPHIETVEWLPGTTWLPTRIRELVTAYGGEVWADLSGPIGGLLPRFLDEGVELLAMPATELPKACVALYDAVLEGRVRHLDQSELNIALSSAKKKHSDDRWRWTRGGSFADITSLYSATIAHWKLLAEIERINYDPLAGII